MSARPTRTRPLAPRLEVRPARGRSRGRRLPRTAAAGIIELMHRRPEFRTYGDGFDVYPTSVAEVIDTAIRWNV